MIHVVGAGLAGSLLALELRDLGAAVTLIDGGASETATTLSYGLMPPGAAPAWRRLQRRHGDLGLRRRWLQQGDSGLPLPAWQIEPGLFAARVGAVLRQARVQQRSQHLQGPEALAGLQAQGPVVLACGAGCRRLAPQLHARLCCSWAGVLELNDRGGVPAPCRWAGIALLPQRFERLELERQAAALSQETWIVDPGLVPCGPQLLAGQITLVRPGQDCGDEPPAAALMEQRLRQGLAQRWPQLAAAAGRYRQAAVSFCSDGVPLAEQLDAGLWVLAGFSGAFGQLPAAAQALARQIAAVTTPVP